MMDNKILVKLIVPELETTYNIYLPLTKRIGNVINLLIKSLIDLGYDYDFNPKIALYNKKTGEKYPSNSIIYNTNIKNGTELILL